MKKSNILFVLSFILIFGGFVAHWTDNTVYVDSGYVNGPLFDYRSNDYVLKFFDYSKEDVLCFHFKNKEEAKVVREEIVSLSYSENQEQILNQLIKEHHGVKVGN